MQTFHQIYQPSWPEAVLEMPMQVGNGRINEWHADVWPLTNNDNRKMKIYSFNMH